MLVELICRFKLEERGTYLQHFRATEPCKGAAKCEQEP
jgi:hypothetical protein